MRGILVRWVVLGVAIALTARLLSGVNVSGGFWAYVLVAAVFGIVNAVIGPVLRVLALPFTIVTLGLFVLVVNAALLGITAWLTDSLTVDGFWWAVLGGLLISVFSMLLNTAIRPRQDG